MTQEVGLMPCAGEVAPGSSPNTRGPGELMGLGAGEHASGSWSRHNLDHASSLNN